MIRLKNQKDPGKGNRLQVCRFHYHMPTARGPERWSAMVLCRSAQEGKHELAELLGIPGQAVYAVEPVAVLDGVTHGAAVMLADLMQVMQLMQDSLESGKSERDATSLHHPAGLLDHERAPWGKIDKARKTNNLFNFSNLSE